MNGLRVLSVASELYPLIKTGGLADVAGALPGALAGENIHVRTLIPGYPAVLNALGQADCIQEFGELFGGPARVLAAGSHDLDLLVVEASHLYDRPGNPYLDPNGRDWPDNALRFAALARVAAHIGRGSINAYQPDVLHLHDWQTALAAVYLHFDNGARPATVMTIHNLAYQGQFGADLLPRLGLPAQSYGVDGVEYYGSISYLKGGLQLADRITTVSPTYADEICTPDFGMGLDGLLRSRSDVLSGILNGIDETEWDPASDAHLAAGFSRQNVDARVLNRFELQQRLGLDLDPDALVLGVVSRLTWQKGLDMLEAALPPLLGQGFQLAMLGAGDAPLEAGFRDLMQRHAGKVAVMIGYNEGLAHLIQAGCDALVVPSRFEPCGLTQLYALRYGAVPIVARVGGLADSVIDANDMALANGVATGLQFAPVTTERLAGALRRARGLFRDKAVWKSLQMNGMATDVSWKRPARQYANLYRELIASR